MGRARRFMSFRAFGRVVWPQGPYHAACFASGGWEGRENGVCGVERGFLCFGAPWCSEVVSRSGLWLASHEKGGHQGVPRALACACRVPMGHTKADL